MDTYQVKPIYNREKKDIFVSVPGSKSITNRALLLAAMAEGQSTVRGILFSDDSRHFLSCLKALGFSVTASEKTNEAVIVGLGGKIPKREAKIDVGSAGTAARFLTAFLGMSEGRYEITASEQMMKRPMDSLFHSLEELGAKITCLREPGHLPIIIENTGLKKNEVTVDIEKSSQFLSALLISSCISRQDFTIHMTGEHGRAYIDLTLSMMRAFGADFQCKDDHTFFIPRDMAYQPMEYQVEPDLSAACYFYAMSPILGRKVCVSNVHMDCSQGDLQFVTLLTQLGCTLSDEEQGLVVTPPEQDSYPGVTVDMSAFSDQTMTMAAVAVFATSDTTITGISHIRFQESDRIHAVVAELRKMGIEVEELSDGIVIHPGSPKPSCVATYEDHRMAMAFSLIGLRSEGIVIENPLCCRKTFENYFDLLDQMIDS